MGLTGQGDERKNRRINSLPAVIRRIYANNSLEVMLCRAAEQPIGVLDMIHRESRNRLAEVFTHYVNFKRGSQDSSSRCPHSPLTFAVEHVTAGIGRAVEITVAVKGEAAQGIASITLAGEIVNVSEVPVSTRIR